MRTQPQIQTQTSKSDLRLEPNPNLTQKHSDWQTVVGAKTENLSQDSEMIEINFNRQSSDGALTTPTMMSSTIMTSSVMTSSMDPDSGRKLSVQSLPSNPSPIQSDADRKPVWNRNNSNLSELSYSESADYPMSNHMIQIKSRNNRFGSHLT